MTMTADAFGWKIDSLIELVRVWRLRMKDKIITRKEAIEKGLTRYFSGKTCPHGHLAEREVKKGTCVVCIQLAGKNYKAKTNYHKKYYEKNKTEINKRNKEWSVENKERKHQADKAWAQQNKDKVRAAARRYLQTPKGKSKSAEKSRRRQASKLLRTPKWLSEEHLVAMQCKYSVATMLNKYGVEKWTVDHIIPLQGKTVCGLHVPWNLQIMTQFNNFSKGNKLRQGVEVNR